MNMGKLYFLREINKSFRNLYGVWRIATKMLGGARHIRWIGLDFLFAWQKSLYLAGQKYHVLYSLRKYSGKGRTVTKCNFLNFYWKNSSFSYSYRLKSIFHGINGLYVGILFYFRYLYIILIIFTETSEFYRRIVCDLHGGNKPNGMQLAFNMFTVNWNRQNVGHDDDVPV